MNINMYNDSIYLFASWPAKFILYSEAKARSYVYLYTVTHLPDITEDVYINLCINTEEKRPFTLVLFKLDELIKYQNTLHDYFLNSSEEYRKLYLGDLFGKNKVCNDIIETLAENENFPGILKLFIKENSAFLVPSQKEVKPFMGKVVHASFTNRHYTQSIFRSSVQGLHIPPHTFPKLDDKTFLKNYTPTFVGINDIEMYYLGV